MAEIKETLGLDASGKAYARTMRKRRATKEGHDELIAKLTPVGTRIFMTLMSGDRVTGFLKGSDRFTITVGDCEIEGILVTSEKSPVRLFYKHGIESFGLEVVGNGD